MKINLSLPDSPYFVRRYETEPCPKLTLNNTDYFETLCVHHELLIPNLNFKSIDQIPEAFCEELSQRNPQVLLLGIGKTQDFSASHSVMMLSAFKPFIEKQIGIESMTTDAAARTYNILAQEGRDVMAIFIL
jgi:uncharacterized protein